MPAPGSTCATSRCACRRDRYRRSRRFRSRIRGSNPGRLTPCRTPTVTQQMVERPAPPLPAEARFPVHPGPGELPAGRRRAGRSAWTTCARRPSGASASRRRQPVRTLVGPSGLAVRAAGRGERRRPGRTVAPGPRLRTGRIRSLGWRRTAWPGGFAAGHGRPRARRFAAHVPDRRRPALARRQPAGSLAGCLGHHGEDQRQRSARADRTAGDWLRPSTCRACSPNRSSWTSATADIDWRRDAARRGSSARGPRASCTRRPRPRATRNCNWASGGVSPVLTADATVGDFDVSVVPQFIPAGRLRERTIAWLGPRVRPRHRAAMAD